MPMSMPMLQRLKFYFYFYCQISFLLELFFKYRVDTAIHMLLLVLLLLLTKPYFQPVLRRGLSLFHKIVSDVIRESTYNSCSCMVGVVRN